MMHFTLSTMFGTWVVNDPFAANQVSVEIDRLWPDYCPLWAGNVKWLLSPRSSHCRLRAGSATVRYRPILLKNSLIVTGGKILPL